MRAVVIATALAAVLLPAIARAQYPYDRVPTVEAREQLYQELVRDAAEFDKSNLVKKAIRFVRHSVVHIEARKPSSSSFDRTVEEAGSGVIIEHQGSYYVLTNRHVVRDAPLSEVKIHLADGRAISPRSRWSDPDTDVAILAVRERGLLPARLGDSDKMEIGDFVLAVGSPFGLSHSVTYGMISARGRRDLRLGDRVRYQNFLQTDAAINPGNSGGPLVNLRGEVIGINTAIASNSGGNDGIGFTIPINIAHDVGRQLVERGAVVRSFLGVLLDSNYDADLATQIGLPRAIGARVKGITENSAAERAELQVGDVILEFDGVRIDDDNHLINQVKLTPAGKAVTILVFRAGKAMQMTAEVGPPEAD